MKSDNSFTIGKGTITVELLDDRVVVCKVVGAATGPLIVESMRRTKILADQALAKGRQPSLLIDISQTLSQDSAARMEAKKLTSYGFERIAVFGKNRALMGVGKYIARISGLGNSTKFYYSLQEAKKWAWEGFEKLPDLVRRRRIIAVTGLMVIGLSALAGWQFDVHFLNSFITTSRPMNPMVAISFLVIALGIAAYSEGWQKSRVKAVLVASAAMGPIIFGILALCKSVFSIETSVDLILFTDKLTDSSMGGRAAISAAILLIAAGCMFWLLFTGQKYRWQRDVYFALSGIIFLATMTTLVMYSFGLVRFTGNRSELLFMAFSTTFGFIFANIALGVMGKPTPSSEKSNTFIMAYWQAMMVFILLILATGTVWQQTKGDVQNSVDRTANESFSKVESTINARLAAYANSLVGYRGLFAASTDVTPNDFAQYFKTIDLEHEYPGFSAITYIPVIPDSQKAQFIEETRDRSTEGFEQLANYSITPENDESVHYPVTYVQPSSSTTMYGFDLATEKVRRSTLEKARDTNEPVASGLINLNASRGSSAPVNNGFFLSEPIYDSSIRAGEASVEQRRRAIKGFAVAYFQNDRLFNDALAFAKSDDVSYDLTYIETGERLYRTEAKNVLLNTPVKRSTELSIAGQEWRLDMKISPQFGRDALGQRLPTVVLVAGGILAIMASLLVLAQLRRRDQAFALAERMTEDLQHERNMAVENQQKDEAILSSIGDAVFAVDTKERITLFNPVCERISGWTSAEAVGMHYKDVLPFVLGDSERINERFVKQALSGRVASMKNHTSLVRRDGQKVAVADSAAPIHNARGKIIGAIVVFRDVTKEYELDRAKTEFVSLASHQLRTPLSAINWFVEMLQDEDAGKLNDDQKMYVREIFEGNQRMIELVNSLLDVSRLDLGKLTNKPEPTDIGEVVKSIRSELQASVKAKQLEYKLDVKPVPKVIGDPKLLRIIVQNLSSNAVKYTRDKGKVTVTLRIATERDMAASHLRAKGEYLYFGVADNGLGIPKEQQSHIFSKLFRADNVRALDVEGTGLGLYLVKQVVEKLGGRIWFSSLENKGTTFSVVLPFKTKHNK